MAGSAIRGVDVVVLVIGFIHLDAVLLLGLDDSRGPICSQYDDLREPHLYILRIVVGGVDVTVTVTKLLLVGMTGEVIY